MNNKEKSLIKLNRNSIRELILKSKLAFLAVRANRKDFNLEKQKCFAITGTGRSGTAFLARVLNYSRSYRVRHEYAYDYLAAEKPGFDTIVKQRFRDHYGEVNSHLRFIFPQLHLPKKAVITRHPHKIILSAMNRHYSWNQGDAFKEYIERLNRSLHILDNEIQKGVYHIRFEEMTQDINVIKKLCEYLQIYDLNFDAIQLNRKINTNNVVRYTDLSKFDEHQITKIDWFTDKYYN